MRSGSNSSLVPSRGTDSEGKRARSLKDAPAPSHRSGKTRNLIGPPTPRNPSAQRRQSPVEVLDDGSTSASAIGASTQSMTEISWHAR